MTAPGDCTVTVRGEALTLLPERAIHWPKESTVFIADPHWGKAAAFRAGGIPVPRGTTATGIARLTAVVSRTGARRIVFLGDYLHARTGRDPETLRELFEWRALHRALELILVRGNHDRHAGDPPAELGLTSVDPPLAIEPFVLVHHPTRSSLGYVMAGHLHPGALLMGPGRQRERLPCFWFGAHGAVLPAFGEFTGLALVEPEAGDRVYAVAGDEVIEVTREREIEHRASSAEH